MIGIKQADTLVSVAKSAGLVVEIETTCHAGDYYAAADYTAPDSLSVRVRITVPSDGRHMLTALWSKRLIRGGRGKLIAAREATQHSSTDLKSSDLQAALRHLIAANCTA